MLHIERGPDGASSVLAREGAVDKHGPEDVLQLLVDDKLDNLVPELRDMEAPGLRLCDRLMTVWAGAVFSPLRGRRWARLRSL